MYSDFSGMQFGDEICNTKVIECSNAGVIIKSDDGVSHYTWLQIMELAFGPRMNSEEEV